MMRLLLAVVAWRVMRRLAAPAIVIALAMLLLRGVPFAHPHGRHAAGAIERAVRPIEHDLKRALQTVGQR